MRGAGPIRILLAKMNIQHFRLSEREVISRTALHPIDSRPHSLRRKKEKIGEEEKINKGKISEKEKQSTKDYKKQRVQT